MVERNYVNRYITPVGTGGADFLNMLTGNLVVGDSNVVLSRTEAGVLDLAIQSPDQVVLYEKYENIWWDGLPSKVALANLQVCVSRLREKLKIVGLEKCFTNHNDVGYEWNINER